jgi:hypothetical protein
LPGFDVRNATAGFRLPRGINGRFDAAMPRDQDAIHQFRDYLAWHLAGFFDDLIQCHRHGLNLAHLAGFDNLEAEEKTTETIVQKIFDELPVP